MYSIEDKRRVSKRISELKTNLVITDYKAIKYAEGEISEEEYGPIREQRRAWRVEINTLEAEMAELQEAKI